MKDYLKIGPEHGKTYEAAQIAKKNGGFFCDALNHNQTGGCPNPSCFKHAEGAPDEPAQDKR